MHQCESVFAVWIVLNSKIFGTVCYVNIDCTAQGVECRGYLEMSGCLLQDLKKEFPQLFEGKRNMLWPGRPTQFRNNIINTTERALVFSWQPPLDSSIRDVLGFFITIHGVDGLARGLHQCIIIRLNQSLNANHYKTEFSVTYSPVFESSIYDFRLVSLPTADLQFDTNDDTLATRIRTKTGKVSGQTSPADWTATMFCTSNDVTITVVFSLPPKHFKMEEFDVTIVHMLNNHSRLWENSSRIRILDDNNVGKLHQLQWNYSHFKETIGDRFLILLLPVDRMIGLGECICYNGDRVCLGGCRQSSCEITKETPSSRISLGVEMTTASPLSDHVFSISTSISLLIISVAVGFILFFLRRRIKFDSKKRNHDTNFEMIPNNHDASEALTSLESTVLPTAIYLRHQHPDAFYFDDNFDPFIKPSPDFDRGSMTLSEQMLQINENYLKSINRRESQTSLCEKSL